MPRKHSQMTCTEFSLESRANIPLKANGQTTRFLKFGSHRARDYGFRALQRQPQGFYSWQRKTGTGGVYEVTEAEINAMRAYSGHARFTILRPPYDDLLECWPCLSTTDGKGEKDSRKQKISTETPTTTDL